MAKESSPGLMVGDMMGTTMMTKSKVMECSPGLMAGSTMDNGLMENNTEREYIIPRRGK